MKKSKTKISKKAKAKKSTPKSKFLHPACPFTSWQLMDQVEKDLTNKKIKYFVVKGFPYSTKDPVKVHAAIHELKDDPGMENAFYTVQYNPKEKAVGYGRIHGTEGTAVAGDHCCC